jgi:hypothetical protein
MNHQDMANESARAASPTTAAASQVNEDLRDALAVLEANGWCQGGDGYTWDGRVCAQRAVEWAVMGASTLADFLTGLAIGTSMTMHARWSAANAELRKHIPEDVYVFEYNDLDSISAEDVKLMFKRAIEATNAD